jgi:predicted signal transduction protein with EAL and GGDEF domain
MQHSGDAILIAEHINEALQGPFTLSDKQVFVRASVGLVTDLSPDAATDEVLRDADTAMYVAKSQGKGRYEIFEPHMQERLRQQMELRGDLQRAVDEHEFVVFYQPVVGLDTGRVTAVEALVRWMHPERGLVAPGEFISLAEDTGLIVPLGRWVS